MTQGFCGLKVNYFIELFQVIAVNSADLHKFTLITYFKQVFHIAVSVTAVSQDIFYARLSAQS